MAESFAKKDDALIGLHGICPGNRLKIIQSHDSGCFTLSPASSPCPTIDSTTNLNSPIPSEIYENTSLCSSTSAGSQRQGKRRSWHIMPNKLISLPITTTICLLRMDKSPRFLVSIQHHGNAFSDRWSNRGK
uniref:Uncharacterized protein n=1 Tax=Anopheles stephensi TaxID=30069 RepID=A0A182YL03_ANOST